ncbi:MAG: hypothetical protein LBN21_12950 [Treponema sp.]|jgi:hypothetical protein|nr:hypothetical protein [Treponema sp.]
MDIVSLLPVFIPIASVVVILVTEIIKGLDKKDRLKGYRVYIPLALSAGAAWLLRIGKFFAPEQVWFWWAAIFGISVFFFEAILKKAKAAFDREA